MIYISIESADIYRHQRKVLDSLNWTIGKDENWVITGGNGSGKSTLAFALAGKSFIRNGKLRYHFLEREAELQSANIYDLRRDAIAIISFGDQHRAFNNKERYYQQRFHAFDNDDITVGEYLAELGFDNTDPKHANIISKCGITPWLAISRVKLSSGQTRKLLICTAILKQPNLLIIDNPYIGLDSDNRAIFNTLLDEINQKFNTKIILAGHYTSLPSCINKRIHLTSDGTAMFIPINDIAPTTNKSINTEALNTIRNYFEQEPTKTNFKHAVSLREVSIAYPEITILDKINWTIKAGEKWALVGNNGSGKSTLLGLLAADHPQVYANDVYLFDQKRGLQDSIWDIKANVGFISSELHAYFKYDAHQSVRQLITNGLFTNIYERTTLTPMQLKTINALLQYFDVEHLAERTFSSLSTGQQRLALILRALIKNPPLLLLDEPFQALDHLTIYRFKHLLNNILTEHHVMIFISHYEEEIPEIVNRYLSLINGKAVPL